MRTVTVHSDDIDPAPAEFAAFYRDTVEHAFRVAYLVARGDRRVAREATQHAYERLLRRWERHELLATEDKLRHVTGMAVRAVADSSPERDEAGERAGPGSARELIARQPMIRRAIAVLFFLEEYSEQEIAGVLDLAEPEILADVDRVRVMLKPVAHGERS